MKAGRREKEEMATKNLAVGVALEGGLSKLAEEKREIEMERDRLRAALVKLSEEKSAWETERDQLRDALAARGNGEGGEFLPPTSRRGARGGNEGDLATGISFPSRSTPSTGDAARTRGGYRGSG